MLVKKTAGNSPPGLETLEANREFRFDEWATMLSRVQAKLVAYNSRPVINGLFDLGELALCAVGGGASS